MPRTAYVNGRYLPHGAACVHIEDRGYQFADGVYEVIHVRRGRLIDAERPFRPLRALAEGASHRPADVACGAAPGAE